MEEVMSDAEDLDTIAKRMEEALDKEVALSFLNRNNQGQGARHRAVHSLSHRAHPCAHQMQPGDHCPRRRGGIFDCLNQQQAHLNCRLSGMSIKFHSFCPISLIFLNLCLLSYFVHLHCTNIHIHLPSFSFLMT